MPAVVLGSEAFLQIHQYFSSIIQNMKAVAAVCFILVLLAVCCRVQNRRGDASRASAKHAQLSSPIDQDVQVPEAWDWGYISEHDAAVWRDCFGTPIATGSYTSPVFNQHMSRWCGACYLVSVLQMLQDRLNIELGIRDPTTAMFPCHQFNFQLALDSYNALHEKSGWNACQGGSPIAVLQSIQAGKCRLELTADATVWLGFPTSGANFLEQGDSVQVEPIESLERSHNKIQFRIFKYGPVVLGIDSLCLRDSHLSDRGGVIDPNIASPRDHATSVVGWKTINGLPCWILRNSWGTETVPKARPTDVACVSANSNTCRIATESWSGDPRRPGYAYVPFRYAGLLKAPSPWYDAIPTVLSKRIVRDTAIEPVRTIDEIR